MYRKIEKLLYLSKPFSRAVYVKIACVKFYKSNRKKRVKSHAKTSEHWTNYIFLQIYEINDYCDDDDDRSDAVDRSANHAVKLNV